MNKPTIMITGKAGQIGYEMERVVSLLGNVTAFDMSELDLINTTDLVDKIRTVKPDILINTAAYTAVDTAEEKQDFAMSVNGVAPGIIAEEMKTLGGLMVHFSTDFAYDGKKKGSYKEVDELNPLSSYAKSKVAGDEAIVATGVNHLIFRTGWIYGSRGRNFLLTMLGLCEKLDEFHVVNDQVGSPTWCRTLAEGVALVLAQKRSRSGEYKGIYNITSSGTASWYDFAVKIAKCYEKKIGKRVTIYPASSGKYPMKAPRPKNAVLDNSKLRETFGVHLPDWALSFNQVMQDMGYIV